jgi:hypothetical protein
LDPSGAENSIESTIVYIEEETDWPKTVKVQLFKLVVVVWMEGEVQEAPMVVVKWVESYVIVVAFSLESKQVSTVV